MFSVKSYAELSKDELFAILRARVEVFVVEQTCPYMDIDGQDDSAHHIIGYIDDRLGLYTRIFFRPEQHECSIGRVIVHSRHRGCGLGRVLMEHSEQTCLDIHNPTSIYLGAQAHLKDFYGSLGYRVTGPEYDEDGIPHLPMRKIIP